MTLKLNGELGSVSLDAPSDTSPSGSDITLTLPTTVGSAEQFLKNSGTAGELEFSSMVEDSSGRVGIGTTSPTSLIHGQVSSGSAIATLESTATSGEASVSIKGKNSSGTVRTGIFKYDNGDVLRLGTSAGIPLRFETNDAERFLIAANGRITAQVIYGTPLSGTTRDVFIEDGGQLGYISSVRDSKTNINLLSNVDWIYQLQPSSFNYKLTDQEGAYTGEVNPELEYGLIAEDVEPVAPELCFYDEVDGEQELRGVHYKKLIVPMLKALQEANAKIETLETKVAALEAA